MLMRVEIVHDLDVGDYLPDYRDSVQAVTITTEQFGTTEYVDITLVGGRVVTLDGLDDIEVGDRASAAAVLTH